MGSLKNILLGLNALIMYKGTIEQSARHCSTFVTVLFTSDQGCFNMKVEAMVHYTALP